jgi:hypothetical protein
MESRFGHDFSRVRVHTDARAAESAHALNASAYTVGGNIVFGDDRYKNHTPKGRQLLAHELSHVMQQRGAENTDSQQLSLGHPGTHLEQEAERLASRLNQTDTEQVHAPVAEGRRSEGHITSAPAGTIQRQLVTPLHQGGGLGGLMERDRRESSVNVTDIDIPLAIQRGWRAIAELDAETLKRANVDQRVEMIKQLVGAYWTGGSEEEAIIRILETTPASDSASLLKRLEAPIDKEKSLIDELDRVVDFGNNLDLHTAISALRFRVRKPSEGLEALRTAPVLPWHDVMGFFEDSATFKFWLTEEGKIRISYYRGSVLLRSTDFAEEIQKLPQDLFTSSHEYEPDQLLIIHDYDKGKFVPVVARDLLGYRNQGIRNFLAHSTEVASLALPGGAAKTVAGRIALVAMERVLPATAVLVGENRLNIVKWFPTWGPRMLYFHDIVQAAVGIYGFVRFAVSAGRIIKSWKEVRAARAALEPPNVNQEAEAVAREFEKQCDEIAKLMDDAREAEEAAAREAAAAKAKPPEEAGAKVLGMEGRKSAGTFEGLKGEGEVRNLAEFRTRKTAPPGPGKEPAAQVLPQAANEDVEAVETLAQQQYAQQTMKKAASDIQRAEPSVAMGGSRGKGGPPSQPKKAVAVETPVKQQPAGRQPKARPPGKEMQPVAQTGALQEIPLTEKEVERLTRLSEILNKGGKWTDLAKFERDQLRLGRTFDKILQRWVRLIFGGGRGQTLHYVDVTPALIKQLRAKGGRVLITQGKLPSGERFDFAEIDFDFNQGKGKIDLIDLTSVDYAWHVQKSLDYKKQLAKLSGLPTDAMEMRYVGTDGELLKTLVEAALE